MKVGLFGAGYLGKFHINNWQEIQETTLVGFYEPSDNAAREICDLYNLKRYYNKEELIEACDIIDVVSPTFHYSICELAIRKGKHVFVEKPMADTIEEAQQLVKLAQESNIKLQVGHIERFNPAFLAAKDLHLHPMYIEAHRLTEFNPIGSEPDVVLDLMIHDIDAILSIVKSDVKHISASGVAVITQNPDIVNARIEFNNGCVANLTSSRIATQKIRKMSLFQKDTYIEIDYLNKSTAIFKLKGDKEANNFAFDVETPHEARTISIINPQVQQVNAIKLQLEEFLKSIKNNSEPVVNEIDGLRAMEVTHQILEKINHNLSL